MVQKLDYDITGEILRHPCVKVLDPIDNNGKWTVSGGTLVSWDTNVKICGNSSAKVKTTTPIWSNYQATLESDGWTINPKMPIGSIGRPSHPAFGIIPKSHNVPGAYIHVPL